MPTQRYLNFYNGYFPVASSKILDLIIDEYLDGNTILEVGFGSGHILFNLLEKNIRAYGIEIRDDAFKKTSDIFCKAGYGRYIIKGDIFGLNDRYDLVYCTGLLQCFTKRERIQFISKISTITKKAIFVVPKLYCDRNLSSLQFRGVAGCSEYTTSPIMQELFLFFTKVREGIWNKEQIHLKDDFLYYVCS